MLLDTRILCILYNSHITFFGHRNRSSIAWVHQKPSAFSFEPLISFSVLSKSSEGRTCKNRLTPLDNRQDNNKIYYPLTHINTHFNSYHVWFRTKEKIQAFSFYFAMLFKSRLFTYMYNLCLFYIISRYIKKCL